MKRAHLERGEQAGPVEEGTFHSHGAGRAGVTGRGGVRACACACVRPGCTGAAGRPAWAPDKPTSPEKPAKVGGGNNVIRVLFIKSIQKGPERERPGC